MASITIEIQDEQLQKLQELASSQGLSPEKLLKTSLNTLLNSPETKMTRAMDYVLEKSAELYRRLE